MKLLTLLQEAVERCEAAEFACSVDCEAKKQALDKQTETADKDTQRVTIIGSFHSRLERLAMDLDRVLNEKKDIQLTLKRLKTNTDEKLVEAASVVSQAKSEASKSHQQATADRALAAAAETETRQVRAKLEATQRELDTYTHTHALIAEKDLIISGHNEEKTRLTETADRLSREKTSLQLEFERLLNENDNQSNKIHDLENDKIKLSEDLEVLLQYAQSHELDENA
eukprot:GHVR01146871.1.p1 GENE.GHVR01146871.1~~GHVR01146871.1.p1  ORF type:complete len:227 (-),score=83.28 GHVR01146871.1:176-856(-)